jgi:hypothetical protein
LNVKSLSSLILLSLAAGVAAAQTAPAKPAQPATPAQPAKPAPTAGAAIAPPVPPPATGPTCFELSKDGKAWSRTPEQLCVGTGDKAVEIKLQTGMPTATTVATFTLDLKTRAKCIDCNKDVFALTNPENSVFNQLSITFNGKRDVKNPGTESGTLTIGKTKFFYRKK